MGKGFGKLVWLGVIALTAATIAGYFGNLWWVLELPSHFRPHLAAASLLWLFFALFHHRSAAVAVCAVLLATNAMPLVPYIGTTRSAVATQVGTPVRVMTYNLHGRGTLPQALIDFIRHEQPDIVLLTEVPWSYRWLSEYLGADYRHRIIGPELGSGNDVIVLSRWPIVDSEIDRSVLRWLPVVAADICAPAPHAPTVNQGKAEPSDTCLRFIGMHATKGLRPTHAAWQKQQFAVAARHARESNTPVVIAGDLNATPWSSIFERLLASSGTIDAALGRGITATWASRQPMIGLVIDHVLTSPNIVTRDYTVGADLGSDHLPVIADLVLPQPKS